MATSVCVHTQVLTSSWLALLEDHNLGYYSLFCILQYFNCFHSTSGVLTVLFGLAAELFVV